MKTRLYIGGLLSCLVSPILLAQSISTPQPATPTQITENSSRTTVDLNTADAKTISKSMKGIGIKRADAIVKYRTDHGPFKSFDDLSEVSGLSKKFVISHFEQLQQAFIIQ